MYFNILWKNGNADKILVEERIFTANGGEAAEALNAAIREFSDECKKKLEADYSNVTVQELFFISTERKNLEESVTAASNVKVEYNGNGRFSIELNNEKIEAVYLSKDLAFMLGFKEREFCEKVNVANFSPDFSAGMSLFYVYAPGLIKPIRVGDTMAPLLRCFATQGHFDDVVEKSFLDPQFRNLLSKEILW
uniref:PAS domain-containing protein n=1 Tax=Panagrellus redivivus TaxID=6233 RepID=A0A7E4VHN3_PANRE